MQEHQRPNNGFTTVIHSKRRTGAAALYPIKIQLLAWASIVVDQDSAENLATYIRPHRAQVALTHNHDDALPLERHIAEQHGTRNNQDTGSSHPGIIAHPKGAGTSLDLRHARLDCRSIDI